MQSLLEYPSVDSLPYAHGGPLCCGDIRRQPEDFIVEEDLGFEPSGGGEHSYLFIEKYCMTTLAVREAIAQFADCRIRDIGYSGLKDKYAVTRQWFSVHLPKQSTLNWQDLSFARNSTAPGTSLKVLKAFRHEKKLRVGAHKSNRFSIRVFLHELQEASHQEDSRLATLLGQRIEKLQSEGFPNYFGEQRFGYRQANLTRAEEMFAGQRRVSREKRGLYLSAVRAFLFNQVLSFRVEENSWSSYCRGDLMILDGSRSFFSPDARGESDQNAIEVIENRLKTTDIHVSGPLYGEYSAASGTAADNPVEGEVALRYPVLIDGLTSAELKPARRALRALPAALEWQLDSAVLKLSFTLPAGSFATALLRELVQYCDVSRELQR